MMKADKLPHKTIIEVFADPRASSGNLKMWKPVQWKLDVLFPLRSESLLEFLLFRALKTWLCRSEATISDDGTASYEHVLRCTCGGRDWEDLNGPKRDKKASEMDKAKYSLFQLYTSIYTYVCICVHTVNKYTHTHTCTYLFMYVFICSLIYYINMYI